MCAHVDIWKTKSLFKKTTNKKSRSGYFKTKTLYDDASEFVRQQEELFCKYYCSNDKVCQYFLGSIMHGLDEKVNKIISNYNLDFIEELVRSYFGNIPNLMDANLLPYEHHNYEHSYLDLTDQDQTWRFFNFLVFFFSNKTTQQLIVFKNIHT